MGFPISRQSDFELLKQDIMIVHLKMRVISAEVLKEELDKVQDLKAAVLAVVTAAPQAGLGPKP